MFGRIRSSSSLDSLERPSSKIPKDDCLSIYEATLMKLKLGSQHESSPAIKGATDGGETDSDLNSSCSEAMNVEACYNPANSSRGSRESANSPKENVMAVDSDSSISTCRREASGDCQSKEYSTQRRIKNFSILYLFSKFKSSAGTSTVMEETRTTEDLCNASMSSSSSASQSTDDIQLHLELEPVDSLTVLSANL